MKKIGIVGSRAYTNEKQMKSVIQKMINYYGKEEIIIVSGGCPDGGDALGKKLALEIGLQYQEFPPAHRPHNKYCVLPSEEYNKPYHVSNYFSRNGKIAEYVDVLLVFTVYGRPCNGTMDTVNKARRRLDSSKIVIFEDKSL